MITDLVQIRTLAEKKRDENFRFRRFMKSRDHSDRILRRIAEGIQEQIDCTACANCCKTSTTAISERDIDRLARHLRISRERFLADYTMPDDEGALSLRFTPEAGCVFLEGNLCSVYEARPKACRDFPHLALGTHSLGGRVASIGRWVSLCPIVYNALERYKKRLGYHPPTPRP